MISDLISAKESRIKEHLRDKSESEAVLRIEIMESNPSTRIDDDSIPQVTKTTKQVSLVQVVQEFDT